MLLTYLTGKRAIRVGETLLPSPHQLSQCFITELIAMNKNKSKEAKIQLAIQAIQQTSNLSIRSAAQLYNVPRVTPARRRAGTQQRRNCAPNTMKLSLREEEVIVKHILDLDPRGFPPRLADVTAMANILLAERQQGTVAKHWANNFVNRLKESVYKEKGY